MEHLPPSGWSLVGSFVAVSIGIIVMLVQLNQTISGL